MYGPEHYLSKIDRNANVVFTAPANVRDECLANIKWAREVASRIETGQIGYFEGREQVIDRIHSIMDEDYEKMGYELPKAPQAPHM